MRYLLPALAVAALFLAWRGLAPSARAPLVVYCAHDSIYSESILRAFEDRTGIPVALRFDTEATKSLGLVELLVQEKDSPRCDVFWNNELLGMLDLAGRGVLLPYQGPGFARIPPKYRAADGAWTGFAARLRVFIFNPAKLSAEQIPAALEGELSRVAMARPLYGTTLTHYSALADVLGLEGLQRWHRETRRRGLVELAGNAAVKDAVVAGLCDFGFTDTDDYFVAKDAGHSVALAPVRLASGRTLCIPNTVAIIRGTRRENDARRLVDFLLSAETELALAHSKARQIPLGPVPAEQLSAEVRELTQWATDGVDLTTLGPTRKACLAWLKAELLP